MVKTSLTPEHNVKKIRQLRLCLFLCGIFSLFISFQQFLNHSFDLLYEGVQILLSVGCIAYGCTLTKKIRQIRAEQ